MQRSAHLTRPISCSIIRSPQSPNPTVTNAFCSDGSGRACGCRKLRRPAGQPCTARSPTVAPLPPWVTSACVSGRTKVTQLSRYSVGKYRTGPRLYVYCGDRSVTYVDPVDARKGRFSPPSTGYYWILAKRGLAWAVSSPIYMQIMPGDGQAATARRTALLANALSGRSARRSSAGSSN